MSAEANKQPDKGNDMYQRCSSRLGTDGHTETSIMEEMLAASHFDDDTVLEAYGLLMGVDMQQFKDMHKHNNNPHHSLHDDNGDLTYRSNVSVHSTSSYLVEMYNNTKPPPLHCIDSPMLKHLDSADLARHWIAWGQQEGCDSHRYIPLLIVSQHPH